MRCATAARIRLLRTSVPLSAKKRLFTALRDDQVARLMLREKVGDDASRSKHSVASSSCPEPMSRVSHAVSGCGDKPHSNKEFWDWIRRDRAELLPEECDSRGAGLCVGVDRCSITSTNS